jgi:ubiquinone/menaquinone biosynthesis C-methylase UbiE
VLEDDLLATADFWNTYVDRHMVDRQNTNRAEWLAHPTVQKHHRVGRGDRSLEAWVADVALQGIPRQRGVGIGAGTGSLELGLLASNIVSRFDLLDVSSGALDLARQSAEEIGVSQRVAMVAGDVGAYDLELNRYDLATCMGSLHHVGELDAVLASVARSLVPEGALVAYEYVGPDRFATGPIERGIAQRLYRALDPSLRSQCEELPLPDSEAVIAADPTEAIHSSEILDTLRRHFKEVAVVHHGGALTYTLWWGLAHDALYERKEGWEFVDVLLKADQALTSTGVFDDYFVTIAASHPLSTR